MKSNSFLWSILTIMMVGLLSVSLISCGDDDDPDSVSVNMPSVSLSASGGMQAVSVTSNTKWTATSNASWLTVSPMQGSGNGSLILTAQANTERSDRSCMVQIIAGSASTVIMVTQTSGGASSVSLDGSYVGTLKPMGYTDNPAPCYVTITKLAANTFRLTSLICETFDINMTNGYNIVTTTTADGRVSITSETTYVIEGSYFQGSLTLNFSIGDDMFFFSGSKI